MREKRILSYRNGFDSLMLIVIILDNKNKTQILEDTRLMNVYLMNSSYFSDRVLHLEDAIVF